MNRRTFLAAVGGAAYCRASAAQHDKADFTLHIGDLNLEVAPRRFVKTVGYNGAAPGPLMRLQEDTPASIEVFNDTASAELVHWHGLFSPSDVDGASEEGTPLIPPHSVARYQLAPRPAGTRWYHSHVFAGRNLHRGTYSGQFGFMQVTPKSEQGAYDQEIYLAAHGWEPFFTAMDGGAHAADESLEVAYRLYTLNGRMLGAGEPIKVREGQRVLFRILNANATEAHHFALPGHKFRVIALDGNRVPQPQELDWVELAPAERIDALVEMNYPGVWILGEGDGKMRRNGLGVVIEYADRSGAPQWQAPPKEVWDYTSFGKSTSAMEPDVRVPMVFKQKWTGNRSIDHWTINGKEFPKTDPIRVKAGLRYRLIFDNQSDDPHPVHLHRHSFELVSVAGKPSSGVIKDVVMCPPRQKTEVQFVANNPGPTLFHCHQQLHMDYGFMAMIEYEGDATQTMAHH